MFLNWALGFRSLGCNVVWLDVVPASLPVTEVQRRLSYLRTLLSPFKIEAIAVDFMTDLESTSLLQTAQIPTLDNFGNVDLLFDMRYDLPRRLLRRAKRSALLDIDPGALQIALEKGDYPPPEHNVLFTIGETVGRSKYFTDAGRAWLYTPPCVFLPEWPVRPTPNGAAWTTVAHWWGASWMPDETGAFFCDDKREAFQAFMNLPAKVSARFELALNLGDDPAEKTRIEQHGFKVVEAHSVVCTPTKYRDFIQRSAGEFSAAKPSYVKYKTAWISDRTLCYLASGKPCVVEDTGPSTILPSGKGLHRVRDADAAAISLRRIYERYDDEAREARAIAESAFDARHICRSIMSTVM